MRVIMLIAVFSIGCAEDLLGLPDGGGSVDARPDSSVMKDGAQPDDAGQVADAGSGDGGEVEDGGEVADGGEVVDGGSLDAGPVVCASLQRDVCLVTPGCVLDGSETMDPGYFCRDALTACEQVQDPDECSASPGCTFVNASCYCAEDTTCICGGGRPQVCREGCGGIAGITCPNGFFCDLPQGGNTGPVCIGNGDQAGTCTPFPPSCVGTIDIPVCGCEGDVTPVTYANDCERRRAGVSFGRQGACP
jgi:hypothetical protein